jgi:acetolactate synthase-1/2/3 large subunit
VHAAAPPAADVQRRKVLFGGLQSRPPGPRRRGFGLKAFEAATPREQEGALDEAFAGSGPVFVDVASEPEVDHLPPVDSWLRDQAK